MADPNGDTRGYFETWLRYEAPGKYALVTSLDDNSRSPVSVFGEQLAAQVMPQTAWRFDYGINTRIVSISGTFAGGYVSGSASQAQLSTSTNVTGSAQIFTLLPLRYLPGYGGLSRFTVAFASGTLLNEQIIGVMDSQVLDGFAFGYDGIKFGVVRYRGGVANWIYQTAWNGDSLSEVLIPQRGNIYQIQFQWLGYGNIYFQIFDKLQRKFVTVHTIQYPNTSQVTSILNPTLRLLARNRNLGNNSNVIMYTPSALGALDGIVESGYSNPLNISNSQDMLDTYSDTNNNHILTIRNKAIFAGQANRVPIRIKSIVISRGASGAQTTRIRMYRNATTTGALSFTDVDASNSPVDTSVTVTTITSTNAERSYAVSQATTQLYLPDEIYIHPGESISFGVQDSGVQSTEVVITVNWEELF